MSIDKLLEEKDHSTKLYIHLQKGATTALPVALFASILLFLSYFLDILFAGNAEVGIGETVSAARAIYAMADIIVRLIFPLLSAGIAVSLGGFYGLSSGLIGGMLVGIGSTLSYPSGNLYAVSGIMGSVIAGVIAGSTVVFYNKIFKKHSGNIKYILDILRPTLPIIIVVMAVLLINQLTGLINIWASTGLAAMSRMNMIILSLLIGIMMTADIMGPLYLAAYVFGTASIATGDPQIMASVMAAGIVPPVSIGVCVAIFSSRFTKNERCGAFISMVCGLAGVTQGAIPYYTLYPARIIPPCILGGVTASMLSMLFGCSTTVPTGGFLALGATENPAYFLLSVASGVFISAAVMGFLIRPVQSSTNEESHDKDVAIKGVTA